MSNRNTLIFAAISNNVLTYEECAKRYGLTAQYVKHLYANLKYKENAKQRKLRGVKTSTHYHCYSEDFPNALKNLIAANISFQEKMHQLDFLDFAEFVK